MKIHYLISGCILALFGQLLNAQYTVTNDPAIPHLRVTHHGYVRLKDREVLPVEI